MRTLRRYLATEIVAATALVTAALLMLFAFFDLIDQIKDLGRGTYNMRRVLVHVLLSVPDHAYALFPVAALIGTLFALARLVAGSEYTVMRTSGVSTARFAGTLASIGLGAVDDLPYGWRALYALGALPVLGLAWLRRSLPETERFARSATDPLVKMIEVKLSQGAKPGHGGVLPGEKVTAEIAEARGVPPAVDCVSPARHGEFSTPVELLAFVERLRRPMTMPPVRSASSIMASTSTVASSSTADSTTTSPIASEAAAARRR